MSVTTITRSIPDLSIIYGMKNIPPDFVQRQEVSCGMPTALCAADTYFLGCRFHLLLRQVNAHRRLGAVDNAMLPWLDGMRAQLYAVGVSSFAPEVRLGASETIPTGVCDLVVNGGPQRSGAVEVKVVRSLPSSPTHEHLLQLGAYAHLLGKKMKTTSVWAGLIYISFHDAGMQLFGYSNTDQLIARTRHIFTRYAA